jgi:hypothetical protein
MTVQAHTSTYSEIVAQLSQCKLSGCVDRTFGDGEYIWINDNNMIIAEAYLSRSIGSFWTCPDGYWIISATSSGELAWQPGDDPDMSSQFKLDGLEEVTRLLTYHKSKVISRNDSSS